MFSLNTFKKIFVLCNIIFNFKTVSFRFIHLTIECIILSFAVIYFLLFYSFSVSIKHARLLNSRVVSIIKSLPYVTLHFVFNGLKAQWLHRQAMNTPVEHSLASLQGNALLCGVVVYNELYCMRIVFCVVLWRVVAVFCDFLFYCVVILRCIVFFAND